MSRRRRCGFRCSTAKSESSPAEPPSSAAWATENSRRRLASGREKSFFIDGGFVQVKGAVVSILTARAIPSADVKRSDAEEALKKASALPGSTEQQAAAKAREIERARRLLSLAH